LGARAAKEMCLALEQVVLKGTGRRAQVPGYRAGGKTGTAEKWDSKNKCYNEYEKTLTFAGILPVHDPKFVCIVTIDEPTGFDEDFQIGGGTIAAPVFSEVAGRVARYLNLAPTEEISVEISTKSSDEDTFIALNPTE
jgi:cell division protein FtsI (penicillin-binding protein 3)